MSSDAVPLEQPRDFVRIPTKPATFSDLKAAIRSGVKPDAHSETKPDKIPIGCRTPAPPPAGRWG